MEKGLRLPPGRISWHASRGIQIANACNIPATFGGKEFRPKGATRRQFLGTHIVADRSAVSGCPGIGRLPEELAWLCSPAVSSPWQVRLVCFDLGGVLVRIRTAWPELCRAAGLEVRGESAGDAAEKARQKLGQALQTGELSVEGWIEQVCAALGSTYAAQEITALHEAVLIEEYAGVAGLIDELHRAGIDTACLSNTNAAHWAIMMHLDGAGPLDGEPRYPAVRSLRSHFASHLMRLTKPAPDIYRAFERATGRAAKEILFFDDLAENVEAARSVGWNAEHIDPTRSTDAQMRDHLARYGVLGSGRL
jgi:putative hydrolase of the HAD superfamily